MVHLVAEAPVLGGDPRLSRHVLPLGLLEDGFRARTLAEQHDHFRLEVALQLAHDSRDLRLAVARADVEVEQVVL